MVVSEGQLNLTPSLRDGHFDEVIMALDVSKQRDQDLVIKVARMGESQRIVEACRREIDACNQSGETEFPDANAFISLVIHKNGGRPGEAALRKLLDTPIISCLERLMKEEP